MNAGIKGRILVTGGAGFIGTNLVRLCVHQGYQVLVLDALTYEPFTIATLAAGTGTAAPGVFVVKSSV